MIQAQPIKNDDPFLNKGNLISLEKRITSPFPNNGHHSPTFNTVHVIAAVIGIIGALVLIIVIVYIFVKRRRAKQSFSSTLIIHNSKSADLPKNNDNNNNNNNNEISTTTNVFILPSPSMSQFQTFQTDFYYDESLKKEEPSSLRRQSIQKQDYHNNYDSRKPSLISFPPPPYNP
ncbi:unnamed protein product [Cunninghamella echinulata]